MTSSHHLPAELRWKAIGKLEGGQCQTEMARWINVSPFVVLRLWRQFQTTDSASRRFNQGRPTAKASSDNRYLILCARRNRTALRLFLDLPLLQLPEGWCQCQLCLEGFTKVVCLRCDQPFVCRSRHVIEGTVCRGHDNMFTRRLMNGGLFS